MNFVRLVITLACVLCSTAPVIASFSTLNCHVEQLRNGGDEAKEFRSLITGGDVSISGPKFTSIDIVYQEETKLATCRMTVGYAELRHWLTLEHRDIWETKWKVLPTKSDQTVSGELRKLTTLIATIDSLGLQTKRSSRERVSFDGKETYGVWNILEISLKRDEAEKLVTVVLAYMTSLDDKDEIRCG